MDKYKVSIENREIILHKGPGLSYWLVRKRSKIHSIVHYCHIKYYTMNSWNIDDNQIPPVLVCKHCQESITPEKYIFLLDLILMK